MRLYTLALRLYNSYCLVNSPITCNYRRFLTKTGTLLCKFNLQKPLQKNLLHVAKQHTNSTCEWNGTTATVFPLLAQSVL